MRKQPKHFDSLLRGEGHCLRTYAPHKARGHLLDKGKGSAAAPDTLHPTCRGNERRLRQLKRRLLPSEPPLPSLPPQLRPSQSRLAWPSLVHPASLHPPKQHSKLRRVRARARAMKSLMRCFLPGPDPDAVAAGGTANSGLVVPLRLTYVMGVAACWAKWDEGAAPPLPTALPA